MILVQNEADAPFTFVIEKDVNHLGLSYIASCKWTLIIQREFDDSMKYNLVISGKVVYLVEKQKTFTTMLTQ